MSDDELRELRAKIDELTALLRSTLRRRSPKPPTRPVYKPGPPPMFAIFVSPREHVGPCVYVLMLGGAFVYVGKTSEGFSSRASDHFTNKRFDTIVTLDIDFGDEDDVDGWLFALEEAACRVLRPSENRAALRGEPHRVAAWSQCIDDLAERIERVCRVCTTPRYVPAPLVDFRDALPGRQ